MSMLRQHILETLAHVGPMTVEQLERKLGVPRATLRSILTEEFYNQSEIMHPQHGKMTVWATKASVLRYDDGDRLALDPSMHDLIDSLLHVA